MIIRVTVVLVLCLLGFHQTSALADSSSQKLYPSQRKLVECVRDYVESDQLGVAEITSVGQFLSQSIQKSKTNAELSAALKKCRTWSHKLKHPDFTFPLKTYSIQLSKLVDRNKHITCGAKNALINFIRPLAHCAIYDLSAGIGAIVGVDASIGGGSCSSTNGRRWAMTNIDISVGFSLGMNLGVPIPIEEGSIFDYAGSPNPVFLGTRFTQDMVLVTVVGLRRQNVNGITDIFKTRASYATPRSFARDVIEAKMKSIISWYNIDTLGEEDSDSQFIDTKIISKGLANYTNFRAGAQISWGGGLNTHIKITHLPESNVQWKNIVDELMRSKGPQDCQEGIFDQYSFIKK